MAKLIALAAVYCFAIGTLGFNTIGNTDLPGNVLTRKERQELTTRNNVIESAKRWLDVYELTGKNDHPMIAKSMRLCGLPGDKGYPWCASCQSEIFDHAGVSTIISARVTDWYKSNLVWERSWGVPLPKQYLQPAQSLGFYYKSLHRYGHTTLLVYASDKRVYCMEGNTSRKGSYDPVTFEMIDLGEDTERDGDAFYPKTHSYYEIDVVSDKCLQGNDFIRRYNDYLKTVMP
ncbi:hypothetical protein [uncultured Draconibacterium sp.]|uniref:hypothetical protein n=1 Tax=uncultured Draconibacterium sp. TaxID=1573823 RepID=UPI0025E15ABF|nr:hypothetical protein [uncultured Draconibacterium sp.]